MPDTRPGIGASNTLNRYWLNDALAKWATSPKPWTTLRNLLLKHMSKDKADGLATEYYFRHFGKYPNQKH